MSEPQKSQGLTPAELGEMVKAEFSRPPASCSEQDAYDFFAYDEPTPAKTDRGLDLIGILVISASLLFTASLLATLFSMALIGLIFFCGGFAFGAIAAVLVTYAAYGK